MEGLLSLEEVVYIINDIEAEIQNNNIVISEKPIELTTFMITSTEFTTSIPIYELINSIICWII